MMLVRRKGCEISKQSESSDLIFQNHQLLVARSKIVQKNRKLSTLWLLTTVLVGPQAGRWLEVGGRRGS